MGSPKYWMGGKRNQSWKHISFPWLVASQVKEFKFDRRVLPTDDPTTVDKVVLDYMATYVDVRTAIHSAALSACFDGVKLLILSLACAARSVAAYYGCDAGEKGK